MEFYHLDQVSTGDNLYLYYQNKIFHYRYKETKIIEPDDWSVIKRQGNSLLTLTTCNPIGTSLNRLVVTADLVEINENL